MGERVEALAERRCRVIRRHHDRRLRMLLQRRRYRASEYLADRVEGSLADAFACHQAKGPVSDLGAPGMPFVREGEHDKAREPELEGRARLPREEFGLRLLALADGVHPGFAEHQRALARR